MKVTICKGQTLGPISGADETLVSYAAHLHRAGVSVSVLLMFPRLDDIYYSSLVRAGVSVYGIAPGTTVKALQVGRGVASRFLSVVPRMQGLVRRGSRRLTGGLAWRYYLRCRQYLAKHKPGVIHVMTPDPSSIIFIRAGHSLRIPILYQELGIPFHPPGYESFYERFTSVLPLCSGIAALSPTLARLCQKVAPPGRRVSVLPVVTDHVSPAPQRTGSDIVFGFAGRVETIKGVSELTEAFGIARRRARGIKLYVAGDGSKVNEIRDRAAALGAGSGFRHLGVYEGPDGRADFLRQIDVFVLPSYTEGTPNSIVEAMSQGIPVIASAVGGIPDVLGKDAGLLVPVGDARALAEAMLQLAGNPELRARMGRAARERYERVFSPKVVIPLLLQTYGQLIAAGRPHALSPATIRGSVLHNARSFAPCEDD